MVRHRLASLLSTAVLEPLVSVPAASAAEATPTTNPPAPTVAQADGAYTVTLPAPAPSPLGVGGDVTGLVVTPDAAMNASTPVVTEEDVKLAFSSPDGAIWVLQVEVDSENAT